MIRITRLSRLRAVAAILTLLALVTLLVEAPLTALAKSQKRSAATSKRGSGKKGRSARTDTRGRGNGKSNGRVARNNRGGAKMVRVRMRGRNGRWVWRRQPVVTASAHGVGVHNFLTDAWASAQSPAAGRQATATEIDPVTGSSMSASPEGGANPTAAPSFSRPSGVEKPAGPSPAGAPAGQPDATRPRQINPTLGETHSINPLVAAYTESLEARGISPEYQGFIVATLNGDVLAEHNADRLFNPASVTKVATTLTAISRLGPDFRFKTYLYTDGTLDRSSGILHGSLYVVGSGDPAFFAENAMLIADKLNRTGIHEVDGNLFVLGQFYFNFSASREASAKALRAVLSGDSGATKSAFPRFLSMRSAEDRAGDSATTAQPVAPPKVKIAGQTITDPAVNTTRLTMIAVHTSLPLIRVLKGLNDFSNNWMATVIGSLVGGPDAVERFLKTEVGFREDEVNFATSSGLGSNAISPRGTVTILRKLISYLRTKGLGLEDMLPIAGVDAGTLEKRFTDAFRGSVVGKTGTLNGVSALAGVAYTRSKGPLLFVIYNHGRSAHTFRPIQDETIKKMITLYGGPSPVKWAPSIVPRVSERADGPGGSTAKNK